MNTVMNLSISTKLGEIYIYAGNQQLPASLKEPCCKALINCESD